MRGYHPNTPKFIIGHSLGALYAARLTQERPDFFKGCILINPLFQFKEKVSAFKMATLKAKAILAYHDR